jgi:hypothetical protein
MPLIVAVFLGLAFIICMGLLRVLRELLADRNTFDPKLLLLTSCAAIAFAQAPLAKGQQAFAVTVVPPRAISFGPTPLSLKASMK